MVELGERFADVHRPLAATEELSVEAATAPWLGEAEAVADDIGVNDALNAAIERRAGPLHERPDHVGDPSHAEVEGHVEAARELLGAIGEELAP